ncbi:enoyl-CoA hydratase [Mycolicibacterium madagascariense]|uniref:Enoyl-CoA hydratase n=1 Tax=Mycolicibacterium madagascariense TaxID=212765 RepID=A0A7I7XDE6_9MYCO|nr:enoyl-CoA hydratase/isomerase family protein [Mycolicibacterium madagascariense]MCV7011678.1 enoyl-CoA hydratase/isomerase family protein [Mycolicibacterium madagascariense]BBZ27310.1 enoyl-CoA hydratase [Mycolicibacterium madagascariense]
MTSNDTEAMYGLPDELVVTADGPIRIVTLNRPNNLNGATRVLHQALARVWSALAEDAEARVVILTGSGFAFSAGGDFGYMQENIDDAEMRTQTMLEARAIVRGIVRLPIPVIAAVNGPAVGLGCSMAVLSDLVLLSDNSFLADPHLRMGLVTGDGGMVWPLLVGLARAKEYLFLGSKILPDKAVELGLASRVVPAADLMTEALTLAHRLAEVPQAALRDTKLALNGYVEAQLENAFEKAFKGEEASMGSPEHAAAVTAARTKSS